MPDEPQNPISEENSIPASPSSVAEGYGGTQQEPMADAPIPATVSTPAEVPPGATEASGTGFSAESNNIPPSSFILSDSPSEQKPEEKSAPHEPHIESNLRPVSEPNSTQTAQKPVFEPLAETTPKEVFPISSKLKLSQKDLWRRFLDKVSIGKRKKLDRVMSMFLKQSKVTNDEVEKFLHVSDATATRYLSALEKENKIKQVGKTGTGVVYQKI